jgi:hypothetical protein
MMARVGGFETVAAFTGFGLSILNSLVGVINLLRNRKEAVPHPPADAAGRVGRRSA